MRNESTEAPSPLSVHVNPRDSHSYLSRATLTPFQALGIRAMRLCSDQPHAEAVCTLASLRQHAAKAGRAHADRPRGAAPADDAPRGGDEALGLPPKLLYVTPERLVTSLQLQRALADLCVVGLLQRVVVDEVTLPLPRVTHSHPRGHRPALCA